MINDQKQIQCTVMRGGTSRALFFQMHDLPIEEQLRNYTLQKIMGSPNLFQVDGLGGGHITTSKVAIIGPPTHPDADIDYLFAQVGISEPWVSYRGNCGNISAAVGPYAIYKGLVPINDPVTKVVIHQVNTKKIIRAEVPTFNRKITSFGKYKIPGISDAGSRITLDFADCTGSLNGNILPTGKAFETHEIDGEIFRFSIVDVGNPHIFIDIRDFEYKGIETAEQLNQDNRLMEKVNKLREYCAEYLGIVKHRQNAKKESPDIPFVVLVGPPESHTTVENQYISENSIDFLARVIALNKVHRQLTVTGAIATAVAARILDTVVYNVLNKQTNKDIEEAIMIGHPTGIMDVNVAIEKVQDKIFVKKLKVGRTSRIIMDGYAFF